MLPTNRRRPTIAGQGRYEMETRFEGVLSSIDSMPGDKPIVSAQMHLADGVFDDRRTVELYLPCLRQARQYRRVQAQVDMYRDSAAVFAPRGRDGRVDHRHDRDLEFRGDAEKESEVVVVHVRGYRDDEAITV